MHMDNKNQLITVACGFRQNDEKQREREESNRTENRGLSNNKDTNKQIQSNNLLITKMIDKFTKKVEGILKKGSLSVVSVYL